MYLESILSLSRVFMRSKYLFQCGKLAFIISREMNSSQDILVQVFKELLDFEGEIGFSCHWHSVQSPGYLFLSVLQGKRHFTVKQWHSIRVTFTKKELRDAVRLASPNDIFSGYMSLSLYFIPNERKNSLCVIICFYRGHEWKWYLKLVSIQWCICELLNDPTVGQ